MARQHGPTAQRHVASPMTVDIARLGRRPGAMFELHDTVHSPARIGLELIAIDQGALLDLDLRVESVSEGVFGDRDRGRPDRRRVCSLPQPGAGSRSGSPDRTVCLSG